MHTARKLSRISDPVYDKDYGNSEKAYNVKLSGQANDKYKHSFRPDISPDSSSGMYGKGVYGNSRLDPRMRRDSDRDCRTDNRDYGKYSRKENSREDRERDRSPRERKWDYKEKSREKEQVEGGRITTCGDWTEHYSSNGKKYYYNCKTEVSQWEKPKEWADLEKSRAAAIHAAKLHCDRNSRGSQDKHSSDHRASPLTSSAGITNRSRERPRRELSNHEGRNSESSATRDTEISSSNDATPTSEGEEGRSEQQQQQQQHYPQQHPAHQHTPGVVSLSAALPRLTSQPTPGLSSAQPGPGPGASYETIRSTLTSLRLSSNPPLSSIHTVTSSQVSPTTYSGVSPPTPTQEDRLPSPAPSSLSSLSAVSPLTALRAAPVSLTPSLGRLYREQLIGHVLGWPAEHLEKASNKVNEEHHNISSHAITKVSAELKMARSLVRLAEIQATLQEQRILFLRQQSTDLEGIGRPQHARVDQRDHTSRDRDRLHDQASRDHESRDHFASGSSRDSRNHVTRETNHATTSHGYLSRGTSRDHDSWPSRELHK